ncbi:MAG: DJ-1/PfpI family protein [Gammaproteobacteria bacterium]
MALLSAFQTARAAHVHEGADTTVAIVMFDGVQIIDFAAPYEVFGQARFNVYTVSADGEPVTTAMGLKVAVDHAFESAPAADVVLVPGGDVDEVRRHAVTLEWLRSHAVGAEQILSICTGSFILADAGLLDGLRATTFHRAFDNFERMFPQVTLVRDQRWVDNGVVVTSAGLASGIDAALHVVAERLGERRARAVAMHLEYEWSPDAGFVRGQMADRHLRIPERHLKLPSGTQIDTVLQLGDKRRWEIDYRVRSPAAPEALIASLADAARAVPALAIAKDHGPLTTAWRYESPHGGHWELKFTAEPAIDGAFNLFAELKPAN